MSQPTTSRPAASRALNPYWPDNKSRAARDLLETARSIEFWRTATDLGHNAEAMVDLSMSIARNQAANIIGSGFAS